VLKSTPSLTVDSSRSIEMADVASSPVKPTDTPQKAPGAPRKRSRRSAAILATTKLATPEVLESYMNSGGADAAEVDDDSSEGAESSSEESEGKVVTVETRQRRTIKRLEEDVNSLKRARKEDAITIANLRKAVTDSVKDKETKSKEESLNKRAAELTETAACISEALIKERFDHMHTLQRLSETEVRLKKLHKRLFPSCCVCQEASGHIKLHGDAEKSKVDHAVCLSCIQGMTRTALNGKSKGDYIECPLCNEKIGFLRSMSISSLADADAEAWLVSSDSVLSPAYAILSTDVKEEAVNTFLDLRNIPDAYKKGRTLKHVEEALQNVSGDYEDRMVENTRPVVDITMDD
jgi:hypothetical protein